MRRILTLLFAALLFAGSAFAAPQGEYKAFAYTQPLGCIGLTTEYGGIPDCYDYNQSGARYEWSQTLRQYVPAPSPALTVSKLPTCTDSFAKNAIAVVSDSSNPCVAGNALIGNGSFVCPVFCNGTAWSILGAAGAGSSGVVAVSGGTGINITGTASSPVVNLTTPVAVANGGTGCSSPVTVGTLPGSPAQGMICTITDSTKTCIDGSTVTGGGSNICAVFYNGTAWQMIGTVAGSATGTVTSVALTMPTGFSVAGSPVTSTGTLAVTLSTENKNTVLAGPTDGSAATPGFRLLGAYDVPGQVVNIANASVTGTTLNKLVKLTGAPSTVVINNTADTSGAIGICIQDCGTTGTAAIQQNGATPCVFDGGTTAGDYVQISSTVNGDCHDAGATYPTSGGEVLGTVTTTNASGGTYNLNLFTPDVVQVNGNGKVQCATLPSLTGDVSNSGCATTVNGVQGNSLIPHRVTTAGATLSVNLSTSLNQFITLHDTITLSFSGAPADGNIVRFKLTQSNGGSHTVTWPASVQWPGAVPPTLTTTNGQADFVQCLYDGTTTNYNCTAVVNFTP